jgi:secondary thiamine-phosphate synthase enzyme
MSRMQGGIMKYLLKVRTSHRSELQNITDAVQAAVDKSGIQEGLCCVFVPHTTAGITVNENADPDVVRDMATALDRMVPWENDYAHTEGNSAAHIKTTMTGSSLTVIIEEGRLLLGTWQGIYFTEYDGPRQREVWVKIVEG